MADLLKEASAKSFEEFFGGFGFDGGGFFIGEGVLESFLDADFVEGFFFFGIVEEGGEGVDDFIRVFDESGVCEKEAESDVGGEFVGFVGGVVFGENFAAAGWEFDVAEVFFLGDGEVMVVAENL